MKHRSNQRLTFLIMALITMGFYAQGCVMTCANWVKALDREVSDPGIEGITLGKTGKPENLVVSYSGMTYSFSRKAYYFAIPFDAHDIDASNFFYKGQLRGIDEIVHELGDAKIKSICEYRFNKKCYRLGSELISSGEFIPANQSPNGIHTKHRIPRKYSIQIGKSDPGDFSSITREGLAFVPYWWSPDSVMNTTYPLDGKDNFEKSCRILLLPERQKRYLSEQSMNVFLAIIETPFTLIADVIYTPICIVKGIQDLNRAG